MKYAIHTTFWTFNTTDWIDKKITAWVSDIDWDCDAKNLFQRCVHSPNIKSALFFDDPIEAHTIAKALTTKDCPAKVVAVTDKDVFKMSLEGK